MYGVPITSQDIAIARTTRLSRAGCLLDIATDIEDDVGRSVAADIDGNLAAAEQHDHEVGPGSHAPRIVEGVHPRNRLPGRVHREEAVRRGAERGQVAE